MIRNQKHATFSSHIRRIKKIKPQGTLLDIGCAKGYFIDLALREGYSSYGLEISEYAGEIARRAVGKDRVEIGTLENSSYQSDMFDIITMFDFLEHVPNLDSSLAAVSRLMRPDGLLYIVTPDTSSLSCKLMGSHWWHYKEEHLYYFNERSLTMLLDRLGYMIRESGPSQKTLSVEYILDQLKTYPVVFISRLLTLLGAFMPPGLRRTMVAFPSGEFYATACRKTIA
ncbi:MAG TPA: class I SAM-dependent methyltransferase [Thermodesulfovibrionales bacterium]|nr:class I SAM-dependent methyltransferase [Thermodesulfovibrionales bacterium]